MEEGLERQAINSQSPNWLLVVAVVLITGLITGGGVFVWQKSVAKRIKAEHQKKVQELKQQIQRLEKQFSNLEKKSKQWSKKEEGLKFIYLNYEGGKVITRSYNLRTEKSEGLLELSTSTNPIGEEMIQLAGNNLFYIEIVPSSAESRPQSYRRRSIKLHQFNLNSHTTNTLFVLERKAEDIISAEYLIVPEKIFIMVSIDPNPSEFGTPGSSIKQHLYSIDKEGGQKEMLRKFDTYYDGRYEPVALNYPDLYLRKTAFESPSSLYKLNLENKKLENISEKEGFRCADIKLSPDGNLLAISALMRENQTSVNKLIFFDVKERKMIDPDFDGKCREVHWIGLNCLRDITWYPDSSGVYLEGKNWANKVSPDGEVQTLEIPLEPRVESIISENRALATDYHSLGKRTLFLLSIGQTEPEKTVLESFGGNKNFRIFSPFIGTFN